jgi:hypothetical protein
LKRGHGGAHASEQITYSGNSARRRLPA